jgi:hypothetical protein
MQGRTKWTVDGGGAVMGKRGGTERMRVMEGAQKNLEGATGASREAREDLVKRDLLMFCGVHHVSAKATGKAEITLTRETGNMLEGLRLILRGGMGRL